ncbi:Translation initiation factor eIF-2B subunit gamma [Blattella germanica]|nr:Translation initiation factor eIF-2B subunit gamma [Blattella germanica]
MVKELQAIVLAAGRGTRMTELTAGKPKCLLPIGNKPMVWYPLQLLECAGIRDAIVVVVEQVKIEVQNALERTGLKIRLEFVGIPGVEDWGTADTLRHLSDKIKTDVLVVSCDLVTDMKLFPVFDVFRKHSAGVVALFFHPQHGDSPPIATPGPKSKQKPERDLVGLDAETSRLVFLASVSDFDDSVPLSRRLMRKHNRISISFGTLKGEMIPYIVKKQLSRNNRTKSDHDTSGGGSGDDMKKDLFHFAQEDPLVHMIRNMSFYSDHSGDMLPAYHGDIVRCYGYVAPTDNFGIRTNTVAAYCDINRRIKSLWSAMTGGSECIAVHQTSDIKSTQMDETCMVGEQTSIAEKTSIKGCNIGANCQIETKVRLTNCIIMNGVKVREGCVLTNCVLCDGVEIGRNSNLTDCLVGSQHSVPAEVTHANEVLTDVNRLMEI